MIDRMKAIGEFRDALSAQGLILSAAPIMDGKLHRVPVAGERTGRKNGAYVGFLDGWPAGHICNWQTGYSEKWKATREIAESGARQARQARAASPSDVRRIEARARTKARAQARTARYAASLLDAAIPTVTHPYLTRKHIRPHDVRTSLIGRLLVPMRDSTGALWSLTAINDHGVKKFLPGGRVIGCFHTIGRPASSRYLLIAEGYATAATLYETLDIPVLVAFTSANLCPVAQAARQKWPDHQIYIAGDDDGDDRRDQNGNLVPNAGRIKAEEAAALIGARAVLPRFTDCGGTDWNDLAQLAGVDDVRSQWADALRARAA